MIGNKSSGIDRIVGRAKRWRIGKVETFEVENGHFTGDGSGKHISALVDAVFPRFALRGDAPFPLRQKILIRIGL